jgi:hypothetical protein
VPEWDTRETECASRTPTFSMGLLRPNGSGAVDLPPGNSCPGCLDYFSTNRRSELIRCASGDRRNDLSQPF